MTPPGSPPRDHEARAARLARRSVVAIAGLTGLLVWNVVFDLWLGQGERQYLWERAKHRLGEGAGVSLKGSVEASVRDALWVASGWTLVVVAAICLAGYVSFRLARRR